MRGRPWIGLVPLVIFSSSAGAQFLRVDSCNGRGELIIPTKENPVEKAIPDLLARIESSYTLFYATPAAKSGEPRRITVELSDEAQKKYPGAEIHAREGYIAR